MENIFTKEQLEELNRISRLSAEEQKKVLPSFLKKLSPEQLEVLKKTQPEQCPICLISEGNIKSKKVYEDDELMAVLEINPASLGHTILFPKKHYSVLSQIKDVGHLFNTVNKVSSLLFDTLNAQGTNILISNGQAAGQVTPHVLINIIPRYANDNLNLGLERKKISEEQLNEVLNKISQKVTQEQVKKPQEKIVFKSNLNARTP